MRITKEPEERKQEILDTAMRIFYEKGYERTSITDIARAIGVAQGLCYRYFPSKEALFDSAVEQYAEKLVSRFAILPETEGRTLKELIETMPLTAETEGDGYYQTFHTAENKKFHDQLTLKVCQKLSGIVAELLEQAKERGEIHLEDVQTAASFCVYGQIGILREEGMTPEEKERRIRGFLLYVLRL